MYMGKSGSIELYKHRETRRYLNIHAESGEFYLHGNRTYMKVSKAAALAYVFGRRAMERKRESQLCRNR
jgi:hypothetical protein